LLLAFTQHPNRFSQSPPPLWVSEWLERRDALADKKTAETQPVERTAAQEEESKKEAMRRAAKRELKVKEGLLELDLWLGDAARQGLARMQQQPPDYWDNMAARLVDAQATGLARRIKLCATLPHSGGNWAARLLDRLSRIHLLIEAARRMDQLPETMQMDIRTAIGWSFREEEVLQLPVVTGRWQVQGMSVQEEDNLRAQRTWLHSLNSRKSALLLHFTAHAQPINSVLPPGMEFDGALVFYPSKAPLRAIVKQQGQGDLIARDLASEAGIDEALSKCASMWANNPWIELLPMAISHCTLTMHRQEWHLIDKKSDALPVSPRFQHPWHFLACSGGHPCTIFGEWDGEYYLPLSFVSLENKFFSLGVLSS